MQRGMPRDAREWPFSCGTSTHNSRSPVQFGTEDHFTSVDTNHRRSHNPYLQTPAPPPRHGSWTRGHKPERVLSPPWVRQCARSSPVCALSKDGKSALSQLHRMGRRHSQEICIRNCAATCHTQSRSPVVGGYPKSSRWGYDRLSPRSSLAGAAKGRLPGTRRQGIRLVPFVGSWGRPSRGV